MPPSPQSQAWQGISADLPLSLLSVSLTYDASITTPSPPDTRPIHMEDPPVPLHPAVAGEKFNLAKVRELPPRSGTDCRLQKKTTIVD
jgi:hypothetical protein